jgi:hypothetical protein
MRPFPPAPSAPEPERACPGQRIGHDPGAVADDLPRDALNAPGHFGGGATRKGHQQYSTGISTVDDQMGDPVCQGVGLPEPAPAMTRSGGPGAAFFAFTACSTARRRSRLRLSR